MSNARPRSSSPRGKRSPRLTLERILSAARDEFADHGLHGASAEGIARRSGISKQLLHRYFGSKEALYRLIIDKMSATALDALIATDLDRLPPAQALREFLGRLFDEYERDRAFASFALDQSLHGGAHVSRSNKLRALAPQLVGRFAAIIERGITSGEFRADIEPHKTFAAAFLLTDGFLMCAPVLSMLVDTDARSDEGRGQWRRFAADFVLAALRK